MYSYGDSNHIVFSVTNNNLYSYSKEGTECLFDYRKFKGADYDFPNYEGCLIRKTGNEYDCYNYYNGDHLFIKDIFSGNRKVYKSKNSFLDFGVKSILANDSNIFIKTRQIIFALSQRGRPAEESVSNKYNANTRIFAFNKGSNNEILYATTNGMYKIEHGKSYIQPQYGKLSFYSFSTLGSYLFGITLDYKIAICNNVGNQIYIDSFKSTDCIFEDIIILNTTQAIISTDNLYKLITFYPSLGKPKYTVQTIENPFVPLEAESICSDGVTCYFFKNGSITSIGINSLNVQAVPPDLFYTTLKTATKSYSITSEVQMSYSESKIINVSFSTLSICSKDVFYQYLISKEDVGSWRELKSEEINLFNLGYGEYTIKIRAKTYSSGYCKPIYFKLKIARPYWATWWFISFVSLAFIYIIYVSIQNGIRVQIKKKEKENENKIRLIRAEYQSLNALMNPHFIFNTLNNVQSLYHDNDPVAANEYLRVFGNLIRQNMQNIAKELIPLGKEIELVENYLLLEKMRFENRLNYAINIDKETDISGILIPPLLIQPLVENSIKHGILPLESGKGFIEVNIYEQEGVLIIEVKDNGIGIGGGTTGKKNNTHESMGIENIKKRIHQLSVIQNKEITFNITETKNKKGDPENTIVTISIPV